MISQIGNQQNHKKSNPNPNYQHKQIHQKIVIFKMIW